MTQQKKKKKKGKSGAKIDLSAPAAEIQITMEKNNSTFHADCSGYGVYT